MEDLKNKIEALLFATGKATSIEEIKRICKIGDDAEIIKAIQDLKIDYDNRDSSLKLVNEGDKWKIITKESYFNVVKKVVTETELSKSLMETLAVIAWKYPIKQCDLIKIRTNKAYAHLDELEQLGYISRQKFGRTKLIKLTERFFSYFDLPPERLKDKFSDFSQIAQAISSKEKEIRGMKEEHKNQLEEIKKMQELDEQKQRQEIEKQEKEIDLIDKKGNAIKLEEYETTPEPETIDRKLGLETYDSKLDQEKQKILEDVAEEEKVKPENIEESKTENVDESSEEPTYKEKIEYIPEQETAEDQQQTNYQSKQEQPKTEDNQEDLDDEPEAPTEDENLSQNEDSEDEENKTTETDEDPSEEESSEQQV